MKKIAVLGCTGSIGTQTLEVVDQFAGEFSVEILAANSNWELVLKQAIKYQPKYVILNMESAYENFLRNYTGSAVAFCGMDSLLKVLESIELDMVIGAMGGAIGIVPTLKALELGIDIGLANKETLVAAGDLVRVAQEKSGAKILPVDSEHSAIFQCMEQEGKAVKRILLTASGGPFRNTPKEELYQVGPAQALKHPNWSMGRKITIDSATLMNKALEVIEAAWLFQVDYDDIKVLVHPQSVVHSMVEYQDGSILGHLGMADMRIPIQYALTWPERRANDFPKMDLTKIAGLTFEEPDVDRFRCLSLGFEAGRIGKSMPAVMNGANEIAVAAFLEKKIGFMDIPALVEKVMASHTPVAVESLEQLLEIDAQSRRMAREFVDKRSMQQ